MRHAPAAAAGGRGAVQNAAAKREATGSPLPPSHEARGQVCGVCVAEVCVQKASAGVRGRQWQAREVGERGCGREKQACRWQPSSSFHAVRHGAGQKDVAWERGVAGKARGV